MKFLNHVKAVTPLDGSRVKIVFEDGYTAELDLAPIVGRGPIFEPHRDPQFFAKIGVKEWGVISWPNDSDIDSDVLRYWCELGRVASQEETDAFFLQHYSTKVNV